MRSLNIEGRASRVDIPYKAMTDLLPDLNYGKIYYTLFETSAPRPLLQIAKLRAHALVNQTHSAPWLCIPTVGDTTLLRFISLVAPMRTSALMLQQLSLLFLNTDIDKTHLQKRSATRHSAISATFHILLRHDPTL